MKAEYNSKFDKNIESFIQLRIEGNSFDEIAKRLKASKQTLIEWNKQKIVREAIKEGKIFKINSIVKTYKFDLTNRIESYLKLSEKISNELLQRDLKEVNTDTLLKMSISNDNRLKENLKDEDNLIGRPPTIIYELSDSDGYFHLNKDD